MDIREKLKRAIKKNIIGTLICFLTATVIGSAIHTESVYAEPGDTPTLVYNYDDLGTAISNVMTARSGRYDYFGSNSHIWFGDVSQYKTGDWEGNKGDAFWRVVDTSHDYKDTVGGMFLASEFTWGKTYTKTQRSAAIKDIYQSLFSDAEKNAIMMKNNTGNTGEFKYYPPTWMKSTSDVQLSYENKLFSLSAEEIQKYFSSQPSTLSGSTSRTNSASGDYAHSNRRVPTRDTGDAYWLRTDGYYYITVPEGRRKVSGPGFVEAYNDYLGYTLNIGYVDGFQYSMRPAFNLDLSKVIFASPAKNSDGIKGKEVGSLYEVTTFKRDTQYGEDWKLTIIDPSRNFTIDNDNVAYDENDKNIVLIPYSGATPGLTEAISAMILDKNNNVKYYGRIGAVNDLNTTGELRLSLKDITTSATDKLYVFSEQVNGDYLTDYASKLIEVNLPLENKFPTVTFEKGNEAATGEMEPIHFERNQTKIKLPECDYEIPDSTLGFIGWKKSGRSSLFKPGEEVTITADTVFTATWGKSWAGLQKQINEANDGATIKIDDDYYATADDVWLVIPKGKKITIDLNGHKLDRNLISSEGVTSMDQNYKPKGSVFYVSGGGTELTINDSSNGKGKICGGCPEPEEGYPTGGGITVNDHATVIFNNGNITGNWGLYAGGVAVSDGAKFIMNDGKISQNNGTLGAAALTFGEGENKGIFTLNDGEITSNINMGFGTGGIYIYGSGIANVNGGKIRSNTGYVGGGVLLMDKSGTLNIKGSPVISNSYSMATSLTDVVMINGAKMNITDKLGDAAKIKVAVTTERAADEKPSMIQITNNLNHSDRISAFESSDPAYWVSYVEKEGENKNEAYLVKTVEFRFYKNDGDTEAIKDLTKKSYAGENFDRFPDGLGPDGLTVFDKWMIKSQMPEHRDDEAVILDPDIHYFFPVDLPYIRTDTDGIPYVYVYATWKEHDHEYVHYNEVPATCYAQGNKEHYTCNFDGCEKLFIRTDDGKYTEVEEKDLVIPVTPHDYGETNYTWAEDYSTVTAVKVCKNEGCTDGIEGHKVEERVNQKERTAIKSATCEKGGIMQYVSEYFYTKGFERQSIIVNTEKLGHVWDEGTVVQELTCTQDRITVFTCQLDNSHTKTETVKATGHTQGKEIRENEVKATCTTAGSYDRIIKCTVCGEIISKQHITIPKPGHDWEVWTEINNELGHFMIRECKRCHEVIRVDIPYAQCTHGEKEEVNEVPATCTKDGVKAHYQCKSCASAFVMEDGHYVLITKENYDKKLKIAALGHAYGEVRYEWAQDGSSVTATRVCAHDKKHVETETATVSTETTPSTCSVEGKTVKSAVFNNAAFETQKRETVIPIEEDAHKWGEWTLINNATCTEAGEETRVCEYNEEHTQNREIAATGHAWTLPVYEWSEDFTSVKASRECLNDKEHNETETTYNVRLETTEATCSEEGMITYTATFTNEAFKSQARTIKTAIDEDAHKWGEWAITKNATCEEDGEETRICQNNEDHVETKAIPATGHDWGEATYKWSADNSQVTARHVCKTDAGHVEEEVADTKSTIISVPTPSSTGEILFTATFSNPGFRKQTKSQIIDKIGSTITVSFVDADGNPMDYDDLKVKSNQPYGDLPSPQKENRVFDAWYTSSDFADSSKVGSDSVVSIIWSHSLYARFKIPVHFMYIGNEEFATRYIYEDKIGEPISAPGSDPKKEGYSFMYWTDGTADEAGNVKEFDFSTPINEPITLRPLFFAYRYTGPTNTWILENRGQSEFEFKRFEFVIDERESKRDLLEDFTENGKKAYVDGNPVTDADYKNGSLIVDLKDSFLNTLSVGKHTLKVEFTDGEVSADFSVIERTKPTTPTYVAPKTGDR